MRRSSLTICTMRRPAMRASTRRRESTAGIAAFVGRPDAERLDHRGHRRRRAHRHAVTGRARHARLHLDHVRFLHFAGLQHLRELPDVRARADVLAAELAVQHRPAGNADRRQVAPTRRPSAARAWSCRSPSAARRRRTDSRGSTPRRPSPPGCGTASSSGASASRRGSSPGTRSGTRRHRARRRARAARARGNARCTAWPATTCCRCR